MSPAQEEPATAAPHTNRLIHETSPYLLQHAHNPVDWYPWGPEALRRAKEEDKPVFLSIGYSACHWCHVMERESFEDEQVAAYMNEHFVCIKVDREERPDLDDVYMKATQALTGSGGWPMSVWLTPEAKPFYAGTYFPPDARYGRPGFLDVLRNLSAAWKSSPDAVRKQAERLSEAVQRMSLQGDHVKAPPADTAPPSAAVVDGAVEQYARAYDSSWGGFGPAPKFPHADALRLLLRHGAEAGDHNALAMAEHTLDVMARGGIYDQLGGGFHRYSTDERWWIPHFEKMLYDNALLVPAYLEAWRITGREDFARVARECCEWVLREMIDEAGGLYSTQDADSEGQEGRFYEWERDEVIRLLGKQHGDLLDAYWNLGAEPNFEGRSWVLVRPRPDAELAAELQLDEAGLWRRVQPLRARLLAAREERVHPNTDDKVLASWNGLMIGALARAAVALEEPRFLLAAQRAAHFCLTTLRPGGRRLLATYRAGKAHLNATLPDHAYLASGLLDLFEADGDPRWALSALDLADVAREQFADPEHGGWFFTSDDHEQLIARARDLHDGALPASGAVMLEVTERLYELTADDRLRAEADRALVLAERYLQESPTALARTLLAVLHRASGAPTVVLARGEGFAGLRQALVRHPAVSMMVVTVPGEGVAEEVAERLPLLAGKRARDGRATAYVCRGFTCKLPVTRVEDLLAQLAEDG